VVYPFSSVAAEGGELFGYLGPNGAGKTTTIRALLDFIRPTAGSATVFGLDAQRESLAIRRFFLAPLLFLIFAIGQGSGAIAGEEERGTLDLLLANPRSRVRIVLEKFGALALMTLGLAAMMWAGLTAVFLAVAVVTFERWDLAV
jgi:ABC-type transport system involved in multi-copper enzyme maturation permease subunit